MKSISALIAISLLSPPVFAGPPDAAMVDRCTAFVSSFNRDGGYEAKWQKENCSEINAAVAAQRAAQYKARECAQFVSSLDRNAESKNNWKKENCE